MFERSYTLHIYVLLLLIIGFVPNHLHAQQATLDVEASAVLENAQVLNLSALGVSTDGSGPVLASMTLENQTGERLTDLFLEITVSADKVGTILTYTQESTRPFSLRPFQSVYITNNDIANEVFPGIEETISFDGGLTTEGDDLIGELSGGTTLPRDVYSMEVVLYTQTDANGRVNIATDVAQIGGGGGNEAAAAVEDSEILLKTPGDVVNTEAEITNPYPQFSWEGDNSVTYRILVVEQKGQDSPESLIQSAQSSNPFSEGGSLLEYENLDILVEGTNFQFPSTGVQPLEPGKTYYWRVSTTIQSSGDQEEIRSEIWNFTLKDQTQTTSSAITGNEQVSEDLERYLTELVGQETFQEMQDRGFTLQSIEYDGQQFSGNAAVLKLEELIQKIRDEEITLDRN